MAVMLLQGVYIFEAKALYCKYIFTIMLYLCENHLHFQVVSCGGRGYGGEPKIQAVLSDRFPQEGAYRGPLAVEGVTTMS